ncbi:MAG TPA: TauD/TfdA family dioxygenase [Streptosporangiaceae bacterium]
MSETISEQEVSMPVHQLDRKDTVVIAEAAERLVQAGGGLIDEPRWVEAARSEWEGMPRSFRVAIRDFRRDSGLAGALIVRGLPLGPEALARTPEAYGSVQRQATVSAACLVLTACGLGDPVAFEAEKCGALVQDVVPVRGQEDFQGNAGSVDLKFHNENAFHPHRPDYVLLLCLRSDHECVAGLRAGSIRAALPLLSGDVAMALRSDEFSTLAPPSFGAATGQTSVHPVLSGSLDDPDIRVDFAATRAFSSRAEQALAELSAALERTARTVVLRPGDLAIIDNRVSVHGRTAFRPRYDGLDRWLQRSYSTADIRRSRERRPADGYVMS